MTMDQLDIRRKALAKRLLELEDEAVIAEVEKLLRVPAVYKLSEEQLEGLNEQLKEYLSGTDTTQTWEEIKAQAAARSK
jgi:hypothetical protein